MQKRRILVVGLIAVTATWAFMLLGTESAGLQSQADVGEVLKHSGIKGGFVVYLGCGDSRDLGLLGASDSYLVQGLDRSDAKVEAARDRIKSQGVYGRISVDKLLNDELPYIDNAVNLLIAEDLTGIARSEVLRVLSPNGVAYVRQGDDWERTVKPRSEDEDDWTHFLHGPDGNPVSKDLAVGPPRHLQWIGSPKWSRHHDHMASMEALVSANGRVFYIVDEGATASIRLPSDFYLAARDAYSGVLLWKKPISEWNTHMWSLKAGPVQLTRRLVAVGDRIYVTLGLNAPVTALDASTGETLLTYEGTENTEEIILSDGVLFLMVKPDPVRWPEYRQLYSYNWDNSNRSDNFFPWEDDPERQLMAFDAESGNELWKGNYRVAPLTMAADHRQVYFYDGEHAVSLDRRTGKRVWRSSKLGRKEIITTDFGPRLIVNKDVVMFAGGDRKMTALSAESGKTLWDSSHVRSGHSSPEDLMVIDGLVWSGATALGSDSGIFTGLDLHSGKVEKEFPPTVKTHWFHQRCYPSKATIKYILPSRTGVEFIDFEKEEWEIHHWVRGGCIYGVMPSNGLIYSPPHSCGCYLEAKLYGLNALAPESETRKVSREVSDSSRLEKGPAYEAMLNVDAGKEASDDWPMYRHDSERSGYTESSIPSKLKQLWSTGVGDKLTSVVIADNRVYTASTETHTLYALDGQTGSRLWDYTAGGRVDSPPAIYKGRVLFGSADGFVYCLRASDGELIWRFRAAPVDRRLVVFEQLESVWPVHGSVLIQNDEVYCTAGRSMFLDDGIRLLRLNPKTGQKISETFLDDRDPGTGQSLQSHIKALNMPVALSDVLSSDGKYLYMRSQEFELDGSRPRLAPRDVTDQVGEGSHLFSSVGFLDNTQFHRGYWVYGRGIQNGYGGWAMAGRYVPAGRILVFDDDSVYGYGRRPEFYVNASVLEFQLFAADKQVTEKDITRVRRANGEINSASEKRNASGSDWKLRQSFPQEKLTSVRYEWQHESTPMKVRAMALAGDKLVVVGPPDVVDELEAFYNPDDPEIQKALLEQDASLDGKRGSVLWIVSASDGKKLDELDLPSAPVFDGMAVAGGRVYMSSVDGRLICLGQ